MREEPFPASEWCVSGWRDASGPRDDILAGQGRGKRDRKTQEHSGEGRRGLMTKETGKPEERAKKRTGKFCERKMGINGKETRKPREIGTGGDRKTGIRGKEAVKPTGGETG